MLARRLAHRRIRLTLMPATVLALFLATGCEGQPMGAPQLSESQARITVPALWAGRGDDGATVGGIEPAEIIVSTAGATGEYRVNLTNIQARGAGPAWRAATSMAAAFATLFVGADPDVVDYDFTVTGPIDGPSAGGILTVGIIAAFRATPLAARTTMTGTITADGTIGPVGEVRTKIESAAREGYTTVVLPAALDPGGWATGNDYTRLADSLGVRLVPVYTIADAYAAMTGQSLPSSASIEAPRLRPPAAAAAREATDAIVRLLASELTSGDPDVDSSTRLFAQDGLQLAQDALADGEVAKAYGTSMLALTRLRRASGAAAVERIVSERGMDEAKLEVAKQTTRLQTAARLRLASDARSPVVGLAQSFALSTSLGWASFAEVTMTGLLAELPNVTSRSTLLDMARSIAEGRLGLEVALPDAIAVLRTVAQTPTAEPAVVARRLDAYASFLESAGQAVEAYLTDVLRRKLGANGQFEGYGYDAAAVAARTLLEQSPVVPGDFPSAAKRLSTALTYYWLVSYAMAASQAYAVFADVVPDDINARLQDSMDAAIDDTWSFTDARADGLASSGIDASAATWSAGWAIQQAIVARDTSLATEAGWLAQGELWYDAVQMSMLSAATQPTLINPRSR